MHDAYRIVIAEDDVTLAALLIRLILRLRPNAQVASFANGLDALNACTMVGADLLFCNHSMPGMDGPTLIQALRARGDTVVAIVGMSGDPFLHDQYLTAGADAFVGGADILKQLPALLSSFLPLTPRG